MNIDQIIQCDIVISESMTIEGGYDSTLIVGPLPANASDHTTPDVSVYSNTDELKDAGFTVDCRAEVFLPVSAAERGLCGCAETAVRRNGGRGCYAGQSKRNVRLVCGLPGGDCRG